eukprot:scpid79514/ scgid16986/ 
MGIVVGLAAEVLIDVAVEAVAEVAIDATVEVAADVAAEAVTAAGSDLAAVGADVAAAAAAETVAGDAGAAIAETAAEVAVESGEAAGQTAAESAVEAAVEKATQRGASEIVKKIARTVVISSMVEELMRNTLKIACALGAKATITKTLGLIHAGMNDARDNLTEWNKQINKAIEHGKLREQQTLPDGVKLSQGKLFSAEMNSKVEEFLKAVQPSMLKLATVSKRERSLGKIVDELRHVRSAFLKAAISFLFVVETWDRKDTDIKSQAGVDFHLQKFASNIRAVQDYVI